MPKNVIDFLLIDFIELFFSNQIINQFVIDAILLINKYRLNLVNKEIQKRFH